YHEAHQEIATGSGQDTRGRLQIDLLQAMKNEEGADGGQEAKGFLDRFAAIAVEIGEHPCQTAQPAAEESLAGVPAKPLESDRVAQTEGGRKGQVFAKRSHD